VGTQAEPQYMHLCVYACVPARAQEDGIAAMVWTCIREVLGFNVSRVASCSEICRDFSQSVWEDVRIVSSNTIKKFQIYFF
jgi:hypothetical protein